MKKERITKKYLSFTLGELAGAVMVLAVVAGFILWRVNPERQAKQARNLERALAMQSYLTALTEKLSQEPESYVFIEKIPTEPIEIGTCQGCFNLEPRLVPEYLAELPLDPQAGAPTKTGYYIYRNQAGLVYLEARQAELGFDLVDKQAF